MLEAIILDFDGVIADSEPLHLQAYQDVFADERIALTDAQYYERYLGFDDAGVFRAVAADNGFDMPKERLESLISRKADRFRSLLDHRPVLFDGVAERIRAWSNRLRLGIASGALRPEIELILDRAGLASCFAAIVAAGEASRAKPARDQYVRAMELLHVGPETAVAIEDSHWGIEAARAAGLRTIAVTHTYAAEQLTGADLIVPGLVALSLDMIRSLAGVPARPE